MEAIFLVCGAGGPQLKRNPLGGKPELMTWVLVAGGAAFLIGNFYSLLAFNNLSKYGLEHMPQTFFWWPKTFAGREHFTEKGWRYRNVALAVSAIVPLAFVIFALRTCAQP